MSKKTVITNPDGSQTVITEETHGCWWWTGTIFLILLVIGIPLVYFPALAGPLLILAGGLALLGWYIKSRRSP